MDASIYAGSSGIIRISVSVATDQFVAHLVVKRTNEIIGKFSYPARAGYQTLTVDSNAYLGKLTPEMTIAASNEVVKIEVKPFVDADTAPIGAVDVRKIADNTLKLIERV